MARKRVEEELAATKVLARRLGLGPIELVPIMLAKHTTTRLDSLPIVARIQSLGPVERSHESASRELKVASHLAARGAPTVRPASLVDPGPFVEGDCTITLWEFAEGRRAETKADAVTAAPALKVVHEALETLTDELPSFTVVLDSCANFLAGLADLSSVPSSDRLFLERLYANLREELDRRELVCRALHGDAHLGNVLMTGTGALWMDLEAVCTGPLEWDAVSLAPETWSEFEAIDSDLMRLLKDLRRACVTIWCWADFDRSSEVREAAAHHFGVLQARFG